MTPTARTPDHDRMLFGFIHRRPFLLLSLALGIISAAATRPSHPAAASNSSWRGLGAIVRRAIAQNELPGAVVLIGHNGRIVYDRAFGERARGESMTVRTIFDCASLTKVVATAPAVMRLVQQGKIRLNDPVARYWPAFGRDGKSQITVRELLTHTSGLRPDLRMHPWWHGDRLGLEKITRLRPHFPPGSRVQYSDVNFIVLGELVHRLTGEPLDRYVERHFWRPLGMRHTRFLPPRAWRPRIAPTWHGLRGVVQDPVTQAMGGVTGAAGMFSTAGDLARFAQMMLNYGQVCPHGGAIPCAGARRILSPLVVAKMTTPQTPYNLTQVRGFGWDLDTPFSTNRGELLPVGSYGHTGYTGTSLWIDPFTHSYIIILSNSVYPHVRPPLLALRSEIASFAAARFTRGWSRARLRELRQGVLNLTGYNTVNYAWRRPLARNGRVLTGLDVLEREHFHPLRGLRVGLVTNVTGVDRKGRRNLDVMLAAGVHVVCGFSPESGWLGNLNTTHIGNTVDQKTGIPVYTAYGATRASRHLPLAGLRKINALVYDIQDVGVRFYTYETTLGYALEAAARRHIPVFVLDRPDPLNGIAVEGPPLSPRRRSFIGFFPGMPVRNGMTVGELARMFNAVDHIHADLHVIRMRGWARGDYYDETGLGWVNPSPNLRNLEETILYPGVALVEFTNVSVGRGTDTPFEVLGAPWIHGRELARYLNARAIPGIRFMPTRFTPRSSKYAHRVCSGIQIELLNRNQADPLEMGIELAGALRHLYPRLWHAAPMAPEIGSMHIVRQIERGEDPRRIQASWQAAKRRFLRLRQRFLLY